MCCVYSLIAVILLFCLNAIDVVHGIQPRAGAPTHLAPSEPESSVVVDLGDDARELLAETDSWLRNFAEKHECCPERTCFWYVPKLFFNQTKEVFFNIQFSPTVIELPVTKIIVENEGKELAFFTHINKVPIKLSFICTFTINKVKVSPEETTRNQVPDYKFLVLSRAQDGNTSTMEVELQLDETKNYAVIGSSVVLKTLVETQKNSLVEKPWRVRVAKTNTTELDKATTSVTLYSGDYIRRRFQLVYKRKFDNTVSRAVIKNALNWATYFSVTVNYSPWESFLSLLSILSFLWRVAGYSDYENNYVLSKWKTCFSALMREPKWIGQTPAESALPIARLKTTGGKLTAALLLCGDHGPVFVTSSAPEKECDIGAHSYVGHFFALLGDHHFVIECSGDLCHPEVNQMKWNKLSKNCPNHFLKQKRLLEKSTQQAQPQSATA